ncbi:site-specific recombinase XerD [Planomicrobium koreense]|uniref:Site-specific recombinase XerD n=1 Tax=Planococcus koreensis TaxID=112331 RepID=A0A7W8FUC0_9BACL|nr:DUF4062 domain-containing protein [Planococcus koreensis]MBB5180971.1 site-specific recombinase XerD [Planococcus koreensis]
MNKKLQIFVSSTYLDLTQERQKAVEGILRAKHIPAGMELFAPSNKTQWAIIQEWIKNSDVLLLIIGGRYGSIEPESSKSYTHLEYDFALHNQIPVVSIVLNKQYLANKKSGNINLQVYEHESENPSIQKYNSFKQTIMSHYVKEVEEINQISTEVLSALQEFMEKDNSEYHFRGWVRGNEKLDPNHLNIEFNVQKFLEEKKRQGRVQDTLDMYRLELKIFQNYFEGYSIDNIETSHLKEFLIYREDNYSLKSKSSLEKTRGNLNVFFDWLIEEKKIERNPVKKIPTYKFNKAGNKALNDKELLELRKSCITLRERALLEVLLSTGCHLSEIKKMFISNIDWNNKTIRIKDSREQERVVFFTTKAEKHLKEYLQSRQDELDNLFISQRRPYRQISHRGIQDEIDNIQSRSTLSRNISPRTLRDTFARLMSSLGYPQNIIDALLGYNSKSIRAESFYKINNENIWDIVWPKPDF